MQLFWISHTRQLPPERTSLHTSDPASTTSRVARPVRAPTPSPQPPAGVPSIAPIASAQPAPPALAPATAPAAGPWDAQTVGALLRQLPAQQEPADATAAPTRFSGGRHTICLPDVGPARVERIVVGDGVSLDERVQGVLALVGLGRIDPCPDIRRHVRSAVAAGDPQEVQYWVDREQRCR